jgi:hypothetical protein
LEGCQREQSPYSGRLRSRPVSPRSLRRLSDLTFADEGHATESALQSTATFIVGTTWYSVTTTGFGDDAASIANLAETIYLNDT